MTPYIETNDAQWTIKQSRFHVDSRSGSQSADILFRRRTRRILDQWHGSIYQESMSLEVQTDATSFEGAGYTTYGFEYEPSEGNTAGHIQWAINGTETWRLNDNAMGPSAEAEIGQRKVSVEPMYINLNLAISTFVPRRGRSSVSDFFH